MHITTVHHWLSLKFYRVSRAILPPVVLWPPAMKKNSLDTSKWHGYWQLCTKTGQKKKQQKCLKKHVFKKFYICLYIIIIWYRLLLYCTSIYLLSHTFNLSIHICLYGIPLVKILITPLMVGITLYTYDSEVWAGYCRRNFVWFTTRRGRREFQGCTQIVPQNQPPNFFLKLLVTKKPILILKSHTFFTQIRNKVKQRQIQCVYSYCLLYVQMLKKVTIFIKMV